jgi:hypothetical protein
VAIRDFWEKRWGTPEPEPQLRSPALLAALADIDRLTQERPELVSLGRSLSGLLDAAFGRSILEPHWPIDAGLVREAWRRGVPAFRAGESAPDLDPSDFRATVLAICEVLRTENPEAGKLVEVDRLGTAFFQEWAEELLAGSQGLLVKGAGKIGVDPVLIESVLRLALLPYLATLSERLATIHPEGIWEHGSCPNCGSAPALGESRGLEQNRRWRCALCAADWAGRRLFCPFCDESDHRQRHYRYAEGEPDRHRLEICDSCGASLIVVSTLGPISPPGLLVAELATAHLRA